MAVYVDFEKRILSGMNKLSLIGLLLVMNVTVLAQSKKAKSDPKIITAKADSLFQSQQYVAAIPLYDQLVKTPTGKSNVVFWNRLGLSHFNLKNFAQASKYFEEVHRLNPRFQGVFLNRAKTYSSLNDIPLAIQMLDSAVDKVGYANHKVLENDPAFENLRKDARYKQIHSKFYNTAYPCMSLPEARQFDFWLGEWDVYQTSNPSVKTGFNKITMQSTGCVVLESWESAGPHSGVSINYFDPTTKTWKQKWAGSGQDITEFYDGKYEDGAMRFKWDPPSASGSKPVGRLTFTNMEPGKVRQHSEFSTDNGTTWQTAYDFVYIRRK